MSVSLATLATRFGCDVSGDPDTEVSHVATLGNAGPGAISFLANPAYRDQLADTQASAVILADDMVDDCLVPALVADDPYVIFARVADHLYPRRTYPPVVHASAVVDDGAEVDPTAHLAALAYVAAGSKVGARAYIGPGCVVGPNCVVGDDTHLSANVTLVENVRIGRRGLLHGGAVLGADGFGHKMTDTGWLKVPQVGGVVVGDDVEVGASTTIDRGAIDDTVIGNGVRLDNQIQIAHNCRVGDHTVIASGTGVSGSTTIGSRCIIAGMAGFVGHIHICDGAIVTGGAVVTKSITKPGVYTGAWAATGDRDWKRQLARVRRLGSYEQRLKALEDKAKDK